MRSGSTRAIRQLPTLQSPVSEQARVLAMQRQGKGQRLEIGNLQPLEACPKFRDWHLHDRDVLVLARQTAAGADAIAFRVRRKIELDFLRRDAWRAPGGANMFQNRET